MDEFLRIGMPILFFAGALLMVWLIVLPCIARIRRPNSLNITQSVRQIESSMLYWGVVDADTSEAQREMALRAALQMAAWGNLGAGAAITIGFTAIGAVALVVTLEPSSFVPLSLAFPMVLCVLFIGALVGGVAGFAIGARAHSAGSPQTGAPTGPIHRSVWDYCAPVIWVGSLTLYGLIAAFLFAIAMHRPELAFRGLGELGRWPALAVGETAVCLALAVPVISLVCAALIARLTMPAVTEDARISERLRAYLHARIICWVLGTPLMMGPMALFFTALGFPMLVQMLPLILYGLAVSYLMPGISRGRLGGRLTGWWWQRRPAPREQAATEGN